MRGGDAMVQTPTEMLLDSFRRHVLGQLGSEEQKFCNDVIGQGVSNLDTKDMVNDYISSIVLNTSKSKQEIAEICNSIENYLSLFHSLLLSYSPVVSGTLQIAEKYSQPLLSANDSLIVVLPLHSLLIRANVFSEKAWYGSREDKTGKLVVVKAFSECEDDWGMIFDGSFIDSYYPHFSATCQLRCEARIDTTLFLEIRNGIQMAIPHSECKLSPNRVRICRCATGILAEYNMTQTDFYNLAMMCYDKWQNRPVRQGTKKSGTYNSRGVSAVFVGTPHEKGASPLFREVRLTEVSEHAEQLKASGWKIEGRASPVEHERRGHTRTLKNGKIVDVKGSVVNKGKSQAVYHIE